MNMSFKIWRTDKKKKSLGCVYNCNLAVDAAFHSALYIPSIYASVDVDSLVVEAQNYPAQGVQ